MKKQTRCKCKNHCGDRRCACRKANEPCDEQCQCQGCRNPLNGVDVEHLTICAIQYVEQIKALRAAELDEMLELPCGHGEAPLRALLDNYRCQACVEDYWYSFCLEAVVQEGNTWHCEVCQQCRDWREWHCDNCNRCTYGVTFPCQHCGAKSKQAEKFKFLR